VGQLISTILVGCAEHILRINENGVKKMCRNIFAIQKTLSDITHQPEQAMDHARQYYELFTNSPEVTY
jgi:exocyst complex component 4